MEIKSKYLTVLMFCGLGLVIIGLTYLCIAVKFWQYTLTPTDLLSTGMAFIGIALAINNTKSMAK
jgi:hypothetical protein